MQEPRRSLSVSSFPRLPLSLGKATPSRGAPLMREYGGGGAQCPESTWLLTRSCPHSRNTPNPQGTSTPIRAASPLVGQASESAEGPEFCDSRDMMDSFTGTGEPQCHVLNLFLFMKEGTRSSPPSKEEMKPRKKRTCFPPRDR